MTDFVKCDMNKSVLLGILHRTFLYM